MRDFSGVDGVIEEIILERKILKGIMASGAEPVGQNQISDKEHLEKDNENKEKIFGLSQLGHYGE